MQIAVDPMLSDRLGSFSTPLPYKLNEMSVQEISQRLSGMVRFRSLDVQPIPVAVGCEIRA